MPVRLPSRRSRNAGPTDPMVAALAGVGSSTSVPTEVAAAMSGQGMGYTEPFSPGSPMAPNWPAGTTPRAWNVPTGFNIISRPRSSAGRMSFETLGAMIASWDIARICIEHIEDDIRSLAGHVTAADGAEGDVTDAVAVATRIMKRPDGTTPFDQWLVEYLEDVLRYDAGALHIGRLRNGQAAALEVVAGTDIAPLLSYSGRRPQVPAPAFTQFLSGVPGVWMSGYNPNWRPGDLAELIYQPFRPQPESPYGLPPMEYLLLTANTDIRFQWHFLNFFTEGTIPSQFAEAPPDQSDPDAIGRWQELWDGAMEGDQSQKHKVKWVPAGTKMTPASPASQAFDFRFPEYLIRRSCAAFKVTPNDLGFTLDVNRSTGETQTDVQFRTGTLPRVRYIKGILDFFLQDVLGLPVQYEFDLGQEKEDRLAEAQAHEVYVRIGAESPDEVRAGVLGLPVDNARPVPRFVLVPRVGPIPLAAIEAASGKVDAETAGPDADAELPTEPFTPIEGIVPTSKSPALAPSGAPGGGILADGSFDAGAALAAGLGSVAKAGGVSVAGLCVKAADTGRILMLQRSMEDTEDPARGTWEFPGGHLEDQEIERPLEGAIREWQEETGTELPAGQVRASWVSGIYECFVYVVAREADVAINADRQVANPDDPDGDWIETVAWFAPADVPNMPALRPECRSSDWNAIEAATLDVLTDPGAVYKAVAADLRRWRANATTRVRKGQAPRRFASEVIPTETAEAVWARLAGARTPADVAEAFEAGERP